MSVLKWNYKTMKGEYVYKQIIVARKDLTMSPGKLAAQVSHASIAFLAEMIRSNAIKVINERRGRAWQDSARTEPQYYRRADLSEFAQKARENGRQTFYYRPVCRSDIYGELEWCDKPTVKHYEVKLSLDKDLYEQWLSSEYKKCVLQAKNKNQLLKAETMAEELGMVEGKDFWLVYDNCHTELESEENGKTLTCIGFRPMEEEIIDQIGKKYHLYV